MTVTAPGVWWVQVSVALRGNVWEIRLGKCGFWWGTPDIKKFPEVRDQSSLRSGTNRLRAVSPESQPQSSWITQLWELVKGTVKEAILFISRSGVERLNMGQTSCCKDTLWGRRKLGLQNDKFWLKAWRRICYREHRIEQKSRGNLEKNAFGFIQVAFEVSTNCASVEVWGGRSGVWGDNVGCRVTLWGVG